MSFSYEPERFVLRWPEHNIEMPFRLIPPGEFRMGSRGIYRDEEPVHLVKITYPFWLGETPVTQAQFAIWSKAGRVEHENGFPGHPDHPAERMTWFDAIRYCEWVARTKRESLPRGFPLVCLPTEAEWEYACRAGTEMDYYTGDGEDALLDAGWYAENSGSTTQPVGRKVANAFGLCDMHGNVWDWCHDVWDEIAYRQRPDGAHDPGFSERNDEWIPGVDSMLGHSQSRVLRGGSWLGRAFYCRSADRHWFGPFAQFWDLGFRLCLACPVRGPAAGSGASVASVNGTGGPATRLCA